MKATISLIFIFCSLFVSAQVTPGDYAPGEIIVQLKHNQSLVNFRQTLNQEKLKKANVALMESSAGKSNIHILSFESSNQTDEAILKEIRQLPMVELAQFNYKVACRNTTPNDTEFINQWNMDMINAPVFWDVATGGETVLGDEIVIAVLDDGFDLNHVDLQGNIWYNEAEIDGDGIDNDGNGFIDDYAGWNWDEWNDGHFSGNHGEVILGIIGASGNNGAGVTGINWNVKILIISGADYNNEIIEAYTYIRDLRRRYNETDGEEGAFIVATNASFGINERFCGDLPVWGAMYDSLGVEGVLSVGATTNSNLDVDVVGDMPTSCPSDYLMTVTNTDEADVKVDGAGYGSKSIDLGAPGQNIFSTLSNNDYGKNGDGTSFSAPHVTGAIGLLYSLPCMGLAELARAQPAVAALLVKDFILNGTAENTSLAGKTVTGGRLDLAGTMNEMRTYCGGVVDELGTATFFPNPTDGLVSVKFSTPVLANYTVRVFNTLGQLIHKDRLEPADYFIDNVEFDLSHLQTGTYFLSISTVKDVFTHKFIVY